MALPLCQAEADHSKAVVAVIRRLSSLIRYTARNVREKYKCWRKTAYTRADTPHEYQLLLEAHRMMYAMLKRVGDCAASPAKEPVRGSLKIGNRTVVCEQCEDGRERWCRRSARVGEPRRDSATTETEKVRRIVRC